ncbi:MAG: hypothetical protein AB1424_08990 [Thermodesulfobacteriota bacterium]
MQLAAMDPELRELATPRKTHKFMPEDHPLRIFFISRQVLQIKLAKQCGVCVPYFSEMLRGIRFMPPDVEEKLYMIKAKIDKWESDNGRVFGASEVAAPQRKAIKLSK